MFFKVKKSIDREKKQPDMNRFIIDEMMKSNPAASYTIDIGTRGKFSR